MPQTIEYDHALDMSKSKCFSEGYIDRDSGVIYLTFRKNGSTVSRQIPFWWHSGTAMEVESWGQFWWDAMKDWPLGPQILPPVEFKRRLPSIPPRPSEVHRVPAPGVEWSDPFEFHFPTTANDTEYSITVGNLTGVADSKAAKPSTAYIGVGFLNVPEEHRHAVTALSNAFIEFAREQYPGLSPVLQTFDTDTVSDIIGRTP